MIQLYHLYSSSASFPSFQGRIVRNIGSFSGEGRMCFSVCILIVTVNEIRDDDVVMMMNEDCIVGVISDVEQNVS
jgi:hypothetical protein